MSDQFFYLHLKFNPKIGHTFTNERQVVVEVPKDLVQRKSESINENLKEVIALDLARRAALGTMTTSPLRAASATDTGFAPVTTTDAQYQRALAQPGDQTYWGRLLVILKAPVFLGFHAQFKDHGQCRDS
jgi:hypothetical protein